MGDRKTQNNQHTGDPPIKRARYEELKDLLVDYGLVCRVIKVKGKEKVLVQTDDPNEEYRMFYDDDEGNALTAFACTIIDNYVNTFDFM